MKHITILLGALAAILVLAGIALEVKLKQAAAIQPPPPPIDLCLQRIIFNECLNKASIVSLSTSQQPGADPITACGVQAAAMSVRPASEIPPYCKP